MSGQSGSRLAQCIIGRQPMNRNDRKIIQNKSSVTFGNTGASTAFKIAPGGGDQIGDTKDGKKRFTDEVASQLNGFLLPIELPYYNVFFALL